MKNILLLLIVLITSFNLQAQDITISDINKLTQEFETKYSIKVLIDKMPKTTWEVDYEFAQEKDYQNLYNYLNILIEEFSKYPVSFIRKSKIKKVVLVKYLSVEVNFRFNDASGVADYKTNTLVFDYVRGNYNDNYQRHTVHHKFYHVFEELFKQHTAWKPSEWINMNIEPYLSTSGWYSQKSPNSGKLTHPDKGFINLYSESAFEEDAAEIFAILFIQEEYEKVKLWLIEDDILAKKIKYMKSFLQRFDNSFNTQYWNRLNQHKPQP